MNSLFRHCIAGKNRFAMAIVLSAVLNLLVSATAHASDVIQKGDIVVVPLRGEVSQSLFMFLRRAIKTAENHGASAIIFEMNTYGGQLDAASAIVDALNHTTIPTYTFINTNAGSAGSIIALATKHIYMAPVSAIGAAAPVLSTGEDLPATLKEKTISVLDRADSQFRRAQRAQSRRRRSVHE